MYHGTLVCYEWITNFLSYESSLISKQLSRSWGWWKFLEWLSSFKNNLIHLLYCAIQIFSVIICVLVWNSLGKNTLFVFKGNSPIYVKWMTLIVNPMGKWMLQSSRLSKLVKIELILEEQEDVAYEEAEEKYQWKKLMLRNIYVYWLSGYLTLGDMGACCVWFGLILSLV